jgi:hypothetical protein
MTPSRTLPLLITVLLLGAGLLATPVVAQSGKGHQRWPRHAGQQAEGPGRAVREPARMQRARLLKRLDLSEEQRARAREIVRQHKPALQAAREARRQDLAGTLTPGQRARMEAMQQELQRRARGKDGPRRAEARPQRRRV